MKKQDIDPANVQIRPMQEENVHAIPLVDTMYAGTPSSPGILSEERGAAVERIGIGTSLVAEARTSIS
jgi:hypothetical protein